MVKVVELGLVVFQRPREVQAAMMRLRSDNAERDPGDHGVNVRSHKEHTDRHWNNIGNQQLERMAVERRESVR